MTLLAIGVETANPLVGVLYLFVFLCVLGMAYWTTRWISSGYSRSYGTQIRVVDRLPVGSDRSLLMVRVGTVHYFLSQDKNGTQLLDRLTDYEPVETPETLPTASFQEVLKKLRRNG